MYNIYIESLAFGGDGIGRVDEKVVFVPFTAPGDLASIEITSNSKSYARARIADLIQSGKDRTLPVCSHFTSCGGCKLQHLSYNAQLMAKAEWLKSSLQRVGGFDEKTLARFDFTIEASKHPFHYRSHLTFHLENDLLGFMANDNKTLIALNECHLFDFPKNLCLKTLQAFALKVNTKQRGRLRLMKNSLNECLVALHFDHLPENIKKFTLELMQECSSLKGVLIQAKGVSIELGKPCLQDECLGLKLSFSPVCFLQNHKEQSEKLYLELLNRTLAIKPTFTLDLYSGIGVTALYLAKHGIKVKGVEWNKKAIFHANENKKINSINSVEFVAADVESALKKQKQIPDVVIANPPRVGMDPKVLELLINLRPKEIFYISCMPTTLARDLKVLKQAGYFLEFVKGYDMFPQTAHLETLVHLKLLN